MSSPRVRELEKKGIVFKIVVSKEDITSRVLLPYECFVCGCKLRSESNAIAHSKNPHHIQQFNRFQQFFNIIPPASFNGRVSLLCKFCDNQPSWEDSKEHTQKHNITSWLKPDNLSHTFFRHYISQHKNVYKCNLCQFLYGSWFHAIDHTKDTRHMQSWNQTSSASAKYSLYENTDPQFNLLISNRIFIGDSSLYHCHVCNLSFSHIESVNTHIESIEHENLIQRYTDDIFEFKTKIPKKMEWIIDSSFFIVMKDKIYCKICDVYFTEISEIEPHVETHKADRETAANNDNEKKDSQEKPNASVTVFSNPKTVPIGECKLQIPPHLHWVVQGHKVLVTPTSLFCTICQKILTNNSAIETHLNKHLQVQWQKSNLPAGYPTGPPASDLSSKDQPSSSSRSTGKTRWNDAPNRKIQTIDLTEDEPPFKGCKLKVPDHLRWVVIDHKIAVNETFLFCPICKKSLNDNASVESHLLQHINLSWQKQNLPAGYPRGPTYVPRAEKNKSFQLSIPNVAGKRNATNSLVTEQTKIQKIDASSKHVFKNVGNSIQILPQNTGATILNVPSTKKMSVDSSVHSPVLTTSVANTSPKKNLNTRPNLVDLMKRSIPSMVANSVQAKTVPKVQILSGNSKTNQQTTTGKNKSTVQPPMNSFPVAKPPAKVHCLNVPQILGKNSNAKQNLVNRGVQETLVNRGVQQTLVNHVGQGNLMNHVGQGNLMNPVGQGTLMNPVGQQILVNRQPLLNFPPSKQINQQPLLNYPNMQINPLNPQTVDQQLKNQQMNQQLKNQQMNQQLSNQQINQQLKNQQMNQLLKNQQTLNQQLKNQQTLNQQLKNQQTVNQLKTQQTINPINLPINQQQNNPSNQKPLTNFRPSNQLSKKNLQLTSQSHLFNTSIMTKLHKANYLFFTRNEIYEMSPEKKRKIILSSQLSFFVKYSSEYFIYCVVCEKSTPYNLQNVYEHWCSSQHNEYLTKLEEDDKQFTNYPNQFSCLALSKEFMVDNQSSDLKMFTCCACDEIVPDQDLILQQHFRDEKHVKNVQRFRRHSQEICKDIFPLVESNWYSIEKYSCWPCKKLLSNELPFAEHLESKKHLSVMQAMSDEERDNCYFDSCAVCGFLWFGDGEEYTKHCRQDSIHKDLTRNIEDRIDYMPEEASHLFASLGNVISELMKEVEKVRYDLGKESELIRSLEVAVRRKFPEAKAYPFGSRVTGLGFTESDIDIFLDCGGFYNGNFEQHIDLIDKIHHCLKLDSQAWSVERIIETSRTPIIKVYHSHSQLKCDVSFSNGLSVENTKLLKCYLTAYPQCKEMILFIKKWLVLCQISGSRHITNYAMSWFVIFYLQTRELLPSVASLMKGNPHPKSIFGWPVGSREFTVPTASLSLSTKELLKGFFSFYADFDYRLNVACPLLGEIITKKAFLELNTLPHEMKPYVEVISNESDPEFFRIDSPMCIQDPYDLSHNLTKGVKKVIVNRFRKLCAKSCRLLSS